MSSEWIKDVSVHDSSRVDCTCVFPVVIEVEHTLHEVLEEHAGMSLDQHVQQAKLSWN